tara:strand:- start:2114 stop:2275 length:162 start_codon:yes stop_codon:yes gene_type:complete
VHSNTKASEFAKCFHCGNLIYNISKLYEKENNDILYCTFCNIAIKKKKKEVEN